MVSIEIGHEYEVHIHNVENVRQHFVKDQASNEKEMVIRSDSIEKVDEKELKHSERSAFFSNLPTEVNFLLLLKKDNVKPLQVITYNISDNVFVEVRKNCRSIALSNVKNSISSGPV